MSRRSEVASQLDLETIRYSMVWEDHALLDAGLEIGPDDHVLSITSAGNNVLSLLLREPHSVTAIDMSPAQCALLDLKLAGIRHLEVDAFRKLMGFSERSALEVYGRLRAHLDEPSVAFWDERTELLDAGLYRCGRLERYFEGFQRHHLREHWPDDLVSRLFAPQTLDEQRALFETEAATPGFEAAFREYFGRESMARNGRDPAQFAYVEDGDVGGYFWRRFVTVCTTLPLAGNLYVERFLTGRHADLELGPEYLRTAEFARLRGLVDRVQIVNDELERHLDDVAPDTYTKAQLSDVFEYMSEDDAEALFRQLGRALEPGGRLAYWNLLVPRSPQHVPAFEHLDAESARLWAQDRSWFYRAFRLETVK